MKRIGLLYLLILGHIVYGQKCVVTNDKMNVAYVAIPNPMSIAVEGYACKDIQVTVDNGELKTGYEPCSYHWYPKEPGRATIIVTSGKQKDKVLGRTEFRVKRIPDPVAAIAGKSGGDIRKAVLLAQLGVVAYMTNFDFDARFAVTGYSVTILHDRQGVFSEVSSSAFFSQNLLQAFKRLETGDQVLFSNIRCKNPDGRTTELLPMEFRIIE